MELELRVNGVVKSLNVAPSESLLTMLRRNGYNSVKQGCETGECGACTVLVDGVPRPSCVMLGAQAGGCTLTTVEGLGSPRNLHPLQLAFADVGAVQCGFCTPAMILSASALLKRTPNPTEEEVRDALSGNLCRCTGYAKPVQAVLRAAALSRGETVASVEYAATNGSEGRSNGTTGKQRAITTNGVSSNTAKQRAVTVSANAQTQIVGKAVPSVDAVKLVTGRAAFTGDLTMHGMIHGCILTSPHAHAVIRSIDVSEAKALPGVHAVLTYQDVQRIPYASRGASGPQDRYSLDYIVRYVGDRVAAVAAETAELAEQAIGLINVEYDVLPAILDPRQALESNAPRLHAESESRNIYDAQRNIAARLHHETGSVEQGFAESDVVVEGEYLVPMTQQTPIENHTVITYFDEDEYLVVRTSTQAPHLLRRTLAPVLGLPARRIRVERPNLGGSFAGKQGIVLEDISALLTLASNRPVKLAYSRADEFSSSSVQQQHIVRMKTGVKRDGTVIANQMIVLASTGAYGTHPCATAGSVISESLLLYPCLHTRFVAEVLYTNLPPTTASSGSSPEFFALECHMDEIAQKLGMDAVELRRKNWIKAGDTHPLVQAASKSNQIQIESNGLQEAVQLVEAKLQWNEKRAKSGSGRFRRGVGIALSLYGNTAGDADTSGATMKLNEDGSFDVFVGVADDTSKTMLAQIAAEVLGVPVGNILLHTSRTDTTPFNTVTTAAETLYSAGGAVKSATEQVRRQLLAGAGRMLNMLPEALKIHADIITTSSHNDQRLTVEQVASHLLSVEGRHIVVTASCKDMQPPISYAAQGVEVEVDTETGMVRVLKVVTAVDAGRLINPMIAEAQVQGSVAQGLGAGICEELLYDSEGQPLSTNLSDYHIYNAPDMPEMQTYLLETENASGPFGAKSVSEVSLSGVAPAIANAVADALEIRIRQLPLTPERVLRVLHTQNAKQ